MRLHCFLLLLPSNRGHGNSVVCVLWGTYSVNWKIDKTKTQLQEQQQDMTSTFIILYVEYYYYCCYYSTFCWVGCKMSLSSEWPRGLCARRLVFWSRTLQHPAGGRRQLDRASSRYLNPPWKGRVADWTVIHTMPLAWKLNLKKAGGREWEVGGGDAFCRRTRGPDSTKILFFLTALLPTGDTTTKPWNVGIRTPRLPQEHPPPTHPHLHLTRNPQVLTSCQNKLSLQGLHMSCIAAFRKCLRRAPVCINKRQ